MKVDIESSWKNLLKEELEKPYFKELERSIKTEYQNFDCYPEQQEIFAAFNHCSLDQLKVVIIGQDPYHGPGQANGLCFSVNDGITFPPSLQNIFKELKTDVGIEMPTSGNLSSWAKQGVLMLNATLTVRAHQAGSHQKKGWEQFTDRIIAKISSEKRGVVFLLWGGFAKKKGAKVDQIKHCVLTSGHPSPLSANRGFWFGNEHFSKVNAYLTEINKSPIDWSTDSIK